MSTNDRQAELFPKLRPRRNRAALERTVAALRKADRLEHVDAALVAAARTSAAALDDAPNSYVAATVLRVHLEALRLLTGRPEPQPDELDAFLRSLSNRPGTATVVDATND